MMNESSSYQNQNIQCEQIVISGISGKFPNSRNVNEFSYNLYNKIDMVDDKETRWRHVYPNLPKRYGKILNIEKFDEKFFGIPKKHCDQIDPQSRMLLEVAYEAILDAGVNPITLRNTNTGVFIACYSSESEMDLLYENSHEERLGVPSAIRTMLANRISYCLDLKGPSFIVDSACSSSLYALHLGVQSIKNGECDSALIGGSNLILHPSVTKAYTDVGVLAPDGMCRSFSNDASGFTRSEAISVIFLQKAKDAKRIYTSVIKLKLNTDGYKAEGITSPSRLVQEKLISELYEEVNIHPDRLSFLEAHSTGTIVGDPEECFALNNALCKNRSKPLLIGSVKSNMGHSEATSGLCSIIKVILSFENRLIPPNINFNESIPILPFVEGKLTVCTEPTKLDGRLAGVNSFGMGGSNAHVLLEAFEKNKIHNGCPTDTLPRLVFWTGRTPQGIENVFHHIESGPLDTEFIGLLHNIQSTPIPGHNYRGFGLFEHRDGKNAFCITKESNIISENRRPVVWVFSGVGSQWSQMGTSLMKIPTFKKSIEYSHSILEPYGIDLKSIITTPNEEVVQEIQNIFVGTAAIQIGLVDLFKVLHLHPDYIIGHSVGELGCAYADGSFTAEEMILSAYHRGTVCKDNKHKLVVGAMAAVGLGYNDLKQKLPTGIEIACRNGPQSCTVSGPEQMVIDLIEDFKKQNIFAKLVQTSNFPFHSKYIASLGPDLLKRLQTVLPNPKKRSPKWLSSSVPASNWDRLESQFSSAEYHTNNLLSPVLFDDVTAMLPKDAILLEFAPCGLFRSIFKNSMPEATYIPLMNRNDFNNDSAILKTFGKLFVNGFDMPISQLYPPISFPVSRGTANISSLIEWDHSEDHYLSYQKMKQKDNIGGEKSFTIDLKNKRYEFLRGHTFEGLCVIPGTAYIKLIWESFAAFMTTDPNNINIEFENIHFIRTTTLKAEQKVHLLVHIHSGSGQFEITENGALVVTGTIRAVNNPEPIKQFLFVSSAKIPVLDAENFYKEINLRGYNFSGEFQSVVEVQSNGHNGKLKWNDNWITFIDGLLQLSIFGIDTRQTRLPTRIRKLRINTKQHLQLVSKLKTDNQIFDVTASKELNCITSGGIELHSLTTMNLTRKRNQNIPVLESYEFVPYYPKQKFSTLDAVRICVQLVTENNLNHNSQVIEIASNNNIPFIEYFYKSFEDTPNERAEFILLTDAPQSFQNISVENKSISSYTNSTVILGTKIINSSIQIDEISRSLQAHGLLISRENVDFDYTGFMPPPGFRLLTVIPIEHETLVVLTKLVISSDNQEHYTILKISSNDYQYSWLPKLIEHQSNGQSIIIFSQDDKSSGVLGFVNCLRTEINGKNIRLVYIDDANAPPFDPNHPFYRNQLDLQQAINIYRNNQWGTYRHLLLEQYCEEKPRQDLCFCKLTTLGDFTSFKWYEGSLNDKDLTEVINIHYNALNFKDVMLASGRISMDIFAEGRLEEELVLGFEFSGINSKGKRVMGVTGKASLNTQLKASNLTWEIPDAWTLIEAATVPTVYSTVYYAFFIKSSIKRGKSVLIHAGSGGVGLAAIRVALAYGLTIFTTVSTQKKKEYLLSLFPGLKESNIGNSRDCSFEKMVKVQTNGCGVDYVLNSLSEEKLQASIRCLAINGTFLEIGKFDIFNDSKIGMSHFIKNLTFSSVNFDKLILRKTEESDQLHQLIERDIKAGIIKPLDSTIFEIDQIEQAFRFLSSGNHVGKVLIRMRKTEQSIESVPIGAYPTVQCLCDKVYVIVGGLGGFALELVDWMVLRGARKFVLNSRRGITTGYQQYRIRIWETYGCQILITTEDSTNYDTCRKLISDSLRIGPIDGIFNLAVLLRDSLIENQNTENFIETLAPKASSTKYLDELSREMCPKLRYFIVFSSFASGRGIPGTSNYGMANSIMERIIEKRVADNLPGKAIQWGAIGDVGLLKDDHSNSTFNGTKRQKMSSVLEQLDKLFTTPEPIVCCTVVAEKSDNVTTKVSPIKAILNIFGIQDDSSVSSNTTLAELGMDSLMLSEINQILETDFEIFLSKNEIRSLTLPKLEECIYGISPKTSNLLQASSINLLLDSEKNNSEIDLPLIRLKSLDNSKTFDTCVILLPGIEGIVNDLYRSFASNVKLPVFFLHLTNSYNQTNITDIANVYVKSILSNLCCISKHIHLIGYSYGSLIALELTRILEEHNVKTKILAIDGGPDTIKKIFIYGYDDALNVVFQYIFKNFNKNNIKSINDINNALEMCRNDDEKLEIFYQLFNSQMPFSKEYFKMFTIGIVNRINLIRNSSYVSIFSRKDLPIRLARTKIHMIKDITEDFGLAKCSSQPVKIDYFDGDHNTILLNPMLLQLINSYFT